MVVDPEEVLDSERAEGYGQEGTTKAPDPSRATVEAPRAGYPESKPPTVLGPKTAGERAGSGAALFERWRVEDRIRRLNALGFDIDELAITTDIDGTSIQIQPKVVDSGHHSRRLLRLTGLDVRENQARRLLNDLDAYTAATGRQGEDEELVAHDWLANIYEPVTRRVPRELVSKLEPAEVFHEVLEHRWYLAERAQHDIPIEQAIDDYVASVLPGKPDEQAVLGVDTRELPVIADPTRQP